ncbi:uncharacterized protein LOC125823862 [Solanum verrucosum]|uniref:uncharacterized protein LOC125823862 n=1 Tax=Solanum verrucosum TaxID=315347 RepID=UPI0020D19B79|nr:uncharacterized protein LOC125823862 [Solanum verrucosum]
MANPKNDNAQCMTIVTQSGKVVESDVPNDKNASSSKGKTIFLRLMYLNNEASNEVDDALKNVFLGDSKNSNVGVVSPSVPTKQLTKVTLPFPQRLKKRDEGVKFENFLSICKSLYIDIPLVEAFLEMLGYAKFLKELVTKKRSMDFEMIGVSHKCSVVMSSNVVVKKDDLGAFTIPCAIGMLKFSNSSCDLEVSINLMPYAIFKQDGLGEPKPTTMRLLFANRSIKHPIEILYDILVKVLIILRRPFLATGKALVDVESGELKFRVNGVEVTFNICKSMKQPSELHVISVVYVIAEGVASMSEDSCISKFLAAILLNYDGEEIQDYYEVVAALSCLSYYSESPLKLDINFKNRESLPAKPSIVEPPKPELKVLPPHLHYLFLGANNTLPVIIVMDLLEWQAQALVSVLKSFIKSIGWTIADIVGIPPYLY